MTERDKKFILKIKEYCGQITTFCSGINNTEEFTNNNIVVNATAFNILQIGELAHNLSEDTKKELVDIPWNQINGMRNRIVHGYDYINMEILWETVSEDIPRLLSELQKPDRYFLPQPLGLL